MDIDLDNPEDVKIIEREFEKIYESDVHFKDSFGPEAFELSPIQKYQIIDAYNKDGMTAVLALLTTSADQSAIEQMEEGVINNMDQADGQRLEGEDWDNKSYVMHNGKKYSRIQIDGLLDDSGNDDEFLMDENGDIYTLDFKYLTNISENCVDEED